MTNAHTTKKQRKRVLKTEGRKILCARMYNDYKCWNSTRCCDHLRDNENCPAFVKISKRNVISQIKRNGGNYDFQ